LHPFSLSIFSGADETDETRVQFQSIGDGNMLERAREGGREEGREGGRVAPGRNNPATIQ